MTSLPQAGGRGLLNFAAFVVTIAGIKAAGALVVPFLLAVFLAVVCLPLLIWLEKKGVPELLGLLLILAVVVGAWVALALLVGTAVADFTRSVPLYQERLRAMVGEGWVWLQGYGLTVDKSILDDIFDPGRLMRLVASTLNSVGGILKNAFMILLMFTFLILEGAAIPLKIRLIRNGKYGALDSYTAITKGVNRYLAIKSTTSLATGVLVYILLQFLGVDFPVLWALLAFLLNFIPNIGSLIASIPPILLALVQLGVGYAAATGIGFLLVNVIIGSIIEPRVMGRGVGLSALVVFLSLVFWGWVLGPIGMLLSVPLTMAIKIALSEHESTSWLGILLGSNKEVLVRLEEVEKRESQQE
ncbi:AI-2E family transporter [Desulfosediminicola sp.]|uniref:AI-2E family transporter n=1 Tax=Desulfosediminicola sp. TaxID=2886825 RepID=UPI003AF1EDC2